MHLKIRIIARVASVALILACRTVEADVVAVVSARSPLAALSKSQVADLFLGKSTRFPGGTKAVPIDQSEGTRARDEFYATFAGKSAAQVKAYWAKIIFTGRGEPPRTASNDAEVKKLLVTNPQAVAYLERTAVDGSVRVLAEP
jgi:ABC-type phosphate transport system substrate-binding protein